MLTVTCKLTFSDGQEAAGKIEARSAGENYPITYTGRVDRLMMKYAQGTASDLELLFRMAAQREGAKFSMESTGEYESKTEAVRRGKAGAEPRPVP
jgi:hypothetical protein